MTERLILMEKIDRTEEQINNSRRDNFKTNHAYKRYLDRRKFLLSNLKKILKEIENE
jgi:sugar-specific transcriptional regulator TrmB